MPIIKSKRRILAFAHIGKTGGTTLIHVLRKNYFLRYCDVLPLNKASGKLLTAEDLRKILYINPFLSCIAGHCIRPYGNLRQGYPNLQYITLLRDPVARCISQYQQRVNKYGEITFKEFLQRNWLPNLQTRFFAGQENLDKAKKILAQEFLLAGVLEKFDEFLAVLVDKLNLPEFDTSYTIRRVERDKNSKEKLLADYKDDIESINELDLELYRYVKEDLFPSAKQSCSENYQIILNKIHTAKESSGTGHSATAYVDYMLRKAYYEPVLGAMRRFGGIRAS